MARMIDPSELEGDDLINWYTRSPAEVEAKREAARQERYDAFLNSIGGAATADDDSATDPQNGIGADVAYSDSDTGLVKARYLRPPAASVMAPPSGLRVGPSLDAVGAAPSEAPASGFFGRHNYLSDLGGYYTDLPSPLNFVMSTPTRWWEIGDGSLVQADEVERIYAEQKRRLKGQDDAEPAARVRVVDNWKDGQIPRADQVERGDRELDPTCAPYGGWERDPNFKSYSDRTKRYETQITHAPGLDYVVRNPGQRPVKFDGCAVWDPRHPLLEAKGPGYASLLPKSFEWGFYGNMLKGAVGQADRQAEVARDRRIEWHIAEPGAVKFFRDATFPDRPPIVVKSTAVR
jgi:hypothetical protein